MNTRLGFAVRVLGVVGLKSHDTRRWQNGPHLSISLAYLRDILGYLQQQGIHFYRFSPDLAPYATHPERREWHNQIPECRRELTAIGEASRAGGVRLTVHSGQHVVLNSPDESLTQRSRWELAHQSRLLDAMGLGPESLVVLHVGGVYGNARTARERFANRVLALNARVRCRLALENDHQSFSVTDCLWIHQETGLPIVFDYLHFRCHNPDLMTLAEAVEFCLATWPQELQPKVHYSSPRTATVIVEQRDATSALVRRRTRAPRPAQHADYVDPFAFTDFLRTAWRPESRQFDVMLEAKAQDLALLRLRENMTQFAPELALGLA